MAGLIVFAGAHQLALVEGRGRSRDGRRRRGIGRQPPNDLARVRVGADRQDVDREARRELAEAVAQRAVIAHDHRDKPARIAGLVERCRDGRPIHGGDLAQHGIPARVSEPQHPRKQALVQLVGRRLDRQPVGAPEVVARERDLGLGQPALPQLDQQRRDEVEAVRDVLIGGGPLGHQQPMPRRGVQRRVDAIDPATQLAQLTHQARAERTTKRRGRDLHRPEMAVARPHGGQRDDDLRLPAAGLVQHEQPPPLGPLRRRQRLARAARGHLRKVALAPTLVLRAGHGAGQAQRDATGEQPRVVFAQLLGSKRG